MTTQAPQAPDDLTHGWRAYCTATGAERIARGMAGIVILMGLALGWFVSPWFFLIPTFAGLNLLQSAVTGFCPPELIYNLFQRR
ncbi:MAG: DUF2892 domain-containing protein [Rhodothermales bacterium]|nr:DUF2892 domain-containing protein [Rhodothermales bacterium]